MKNIPRTIIRDFEKRWRTSLIAREKSTLSMGDYLTIPVDHYFRQTKDMEILKHQLNDMQKAVARQRILLHNTKNRLLMEGPPKASVMRCRSFVDEIKDDTTKIPIRVECLGPIDELHGYCLKCGIDVCLECGLSVDIDDTHVCLDSDKRNLAELVSSSKACPQCHLPIEKAEGCTIMFCTQCYTPFDWNSLEIIHGRFHHPEHDRLVANGTIIPRQSDGEGDNFLVFNDVSTMVSYPRDAGKLFFLYDLLYEMITRYKDAITIANGKLNYAKQVYKRGMISNVGFEDIIFATHKIQEETPPILEGLRRIKRHIQSHLEVVTSIIAVGIDYVRDEIIIGARDTYSKVGVILSDLILNNPPFCAEWYEFCNTISTAAPHGILTIPRQNTTLVHQNLQQNALENLMAIFTGIPTNNNLDDEGGLNNPIFRGDNAIDFAANFF